ncbi:A24 family peptidase [Vibrio sp.]|nr:A24 family peptidase [Vibrio sp.]
MDIIDWRVFDYAPWLFPTFVFIFSLMIGSFLNVVIYRVPKMMENDWQRECSESFPEGNIPVPDELLTLSKPHSSCPKCGNRIRIIDNIPVISWVILKGKCHFCHNPISARYPMIELLTAFMGLAIALRFGHSEYTLTLLLFTFTLISLTFIDLDTMLLPDSLTQPLIWGGLLCALLNISPVSIEDALIGTMVGYLALWIVYWGFKLFTGKEGMGYGDFKLLAALGAWLGWQMLPLIILLSSVVGLVFGLIQLHLRQQGTEHAFPFGPYLAIAGWIALLWGHGIIDWYLTFSGLN